MTALHPTDRRLAALVDGRLSAAEAAEVNDHVTGCRRCLQRLGQCNGRRSVPDGSSLAGQEPVLAPEASWEDRDVDPATGEVWRMAWEGIVELAVIRATDPDGLRLSVLPIADVEFADEWSLVTEAIAAEVGLPVAVSAAHEVSVPWCVLDARVGKVSDAALADLAALRQSFRSGTDPAAELRRGEPVWSRRDDRAEALDDLADRFHELANADYVPAAQVQAVQARELPSYDELRAAGLPPNRIVALRRGDDPTPEEAATIESVTGRRLASTGAVVPIDLRRQLDRPRWRPAVQRRAALHGRTEAAETLAIAAEVTQPMAARGTGGGAIEWGVLLQQVLDD